MEIELLFHTGINNVFAHAIHKASGNVPVFYQLKYWSSTDLVIVDLVQ